jgi:hypothetical protein
MASDLPVILTFDPSSILKGREKEWNQYNDIADCYMIQVVIDELEFLTRRATNSHNEVIAREFQRFFPYSSWQTHIGLSSHPQIKMPNGENLSKKVRLQATIAESLYNLSQTYPEKLLVFVCNETNLRHNLDSLRLNNLICFTLPQFNQWLHTNEVPKEVDNILRFINKDYKPKHKNHYSYFFVDKAPKKSATNFIQRRNKTNPFSTIILTLLTIVFLSMSGILTWYFFQPESLQKFLQKTQLQIQK